MNLLKLLASMVKECDYSATINDKRNYITFAKKLNDRHIKPRKRKSRDIKSYRLTLDGMNANISRVYIRTKGSNGRPFFIPEDKMLLSVDLHDPDSLKTIRDWLKTK